MFNWRHISNDLQRSRTAALKWYKQYFLFSETLWRGIKFGKDFKVCQIHRFAGLRAHGRKIYHGRQLYIFFVLLFRGGGCTQHCLLYLAQAQDDILYLKSRLRQLKTKLKMFLAFSMLSHWQRKTFVGNKWRCGHGERTSCSQHCWCKFHTEK